MGLGDVFKQRVALIVFNLSYFVRTHGVNGLKRWIARKLSLSYALRVRAARRKARRFYYASIRRGWALGEPPDR